MNRQPLDLVIIGNGAAAAEAALALRGAGFQGELDLFADNAHPPYNPMLGTYFAGGAIPAERCFPYGQAEFYRRYRIRSHLEARVVRLDPAGKHLTTAQGGRFAYRRCLVATGAATVFPPVSGLDLPGVLGLRSFADAVRLKGAVATVTARAAARQARGLVVGASFAGLEVAGVLRRSGMDVSIIEREDTVLPLVAHAECARAIERHLRAAGYTLRLGMSLEGVAAVGGLLRASMRPMARGGAGGTGGARDAAEEAADLIVVCTGSRPNLGFLEAGEVAAETGLLVDEHLQTTAPDLFAAGDVAQAFCPVSGSHEVVARWANARCQGRVAGLNMAGVHAEYPGSVPCNIQQVGDLLFAAGGSLGESDKVEVSGDANGLQALAYKGGRLAGFNVLGDARLAGPLVQALARGAGSNGLVADLAVPWLKRTPWISLSAN